MNGNFKTKEELVDYLFGSNITCFSQSTAENLMKRNRSGEGNNIFSFVVKIDTKLK